MNYDNIKMNYDIIMIIIIYYNTQVYI